MSRKNTSKPCSADAEEARRAAFEGEVPELGQDFFDRARIRIGDRILREADGTLTRRGRPPHGARAKVQQSLRLSPEVIEHFRAGGPGWQARIDAVLRRHVAEAGEARAVAEERASYRADEGDRTET
jgi:uncharacterized protein (DUF4415 family)